MERGMAVSSALHLASNLISASVFHPLQFLGATLESNQFSLV